MTKFMIPVACVVALAFPVATRAASFQGLPDLPGGMVLTYANNISADGSVVVGSSHSSLGYEAFQWTRSGGMVGLGNQPGNWHFHTVFAASADGSVLVGHGYRPSGPIHAVRWTQAGGIVDLGDLLPTGYLSSATDLSADGSVVVGSAAGISNNDSEAFRWTEADGIIFLGHLPFGEFYGFAAGVSSDSAVVVGTSGSESGFEAFRWSEAEGMIGLGHLPGGGAKSDARDVSADGSVVVGYSDSASGGEAFRWTQADGIMGLGNLPGRAGSIAIATSADGSVVVGTASDDSGPAFIWDAAHGIRDLREVLIADYGLSASLDGWELSTAWGISADGRTIVGEGTLHGEPFHSWIAVIPEPSSAAMVLLGVIGLGVCARRRKIVRLALLFTMFLTHGAQAASFQGLGDLLGEPFESSALGISADGTTVVGSANRDTAFRWTTASGMTALTDDAGLALAPASDVSADGTWIAGNSYLWSAAQGTIPLGAMPHVTGISDDGSVVAGLRFGASPLDNGTNALRWTADQGVTVLANGSLALGVSGDGRVIVGRKYYRIWANPQLLSWAVRWTEAGESSLGDLVGGSVNGVALAASYDGSAIVGSSSSAAGTEAFRWTEEEGMIGLGFLPTRNWSSAYDVSADGSVIVGVSGTSGVGGTIEESVAFIWDAAIGMRNLQQFLIDEFDLANQLAGWQLDSATGISADGSVIVGYGTNPQGFTEAWLARLEPLPALPGDYNQNGIVDAADYTVWRDHLGGTSLANRGPGISGPIGQADYDYWKSHFGQTLGSVASGTDGASPSRAPVPEPSSIVFAAFGLSGLLFCRANLAAARRVLHLSRKCP